jgi:predicted nucleotidyltransferase
LKTMSGVEYNEAIATALTLKADENCQEIFRYIGYCIFLGKTDREIAVKWRMKPLHVEAIRMLFYDFSRLPKDTVAKMTFFRQLVINGKLTDADFEFYKLLNDLGDIGLKAKTNYKLLTIDEQLAIENYLGSAMVENVLKLKMSVRTLKDSLNFNNVLNMLGNFYIKKAEIGLTGAKVKNLEASTKKIETDLGNIVKGGQEHEKLFDTVKNMESTVRMLSLLDSPIPEYKPITDLK